MTTETGGYGFEQLGEYGGIEIQPGKYNLDKPGDCPDTLLIPPTRVVDNAAELDIALVDGSELSTVDLMNPWEDQLAPESNYYLPDRRIFISGGHQHAFAAWSAAYHEGFRGLELIHVDHHPDRQEAHLPGIPATVEEAERYVAELGETCFIEPALDLGVIEGVADLGVTDEPNRDNLKRLADEYSGQDYILDFDTDVFRRFSPQLLKTGEDPYGYPEAARHDDYEGVYGELAGLVEGAVLTTIATSPTYIRQEEAVEHVESLVKEVYGLEEIAGEDGWVGLVERPDNPWR